MTEETNQPDYFPFPSQEYKDAYLTALRISGVNYVEVDFQGEGDSGDYGTPWFGMTDEHVAEDAGKMPLRWPFRQSTYNRYGDSLDKWETVTGVADRTMSEIAQELAQVALDTTGMDWYNNDGGQGSFVIDIRGDKPVIKMHVEINERRVDTYDYDYGTGI